MPESIASAILFDQSIVNYRPMLATIQKPVLLCFGREEKLIPVAAGEYLHEHIANSELIIFENSCIARFLKRQIFSTRRSMSFFSSLINNSPYFACKLTKKMGRAKHHPM
ncbi:alpha/beta fold hydrolase [Bacillus sp. V33-4]|uniref:alpha/beta fold hydrolase n=1 Tax=Bacillus sp. V33-4 TaxID=2054169 RepID=UPI0035B50F32